MTGGVHDGIGVQEAIALYYTLQPILFG